ncbi:MAG: YceD family protein [Gammaproteobacteria bacterium]
MRPAPPQLLDISRLVKQGAELHGFFSIAELPRLRDALYDDSGQVDYRLEFSRHADGFEQITGQYHADVMVTCQRCMQPMAVELGTDIRLVVVAADTRAQQLPEDFEPLQQTTAAPDLVTLIEDEVLLALPFAPLHRAEDCKAVAAESAHTPDAESGAPRQQPFAELDKLLQSAKKSAGKD